MTPKDGRILGWTLLFCILLMTIWYVVASDYSYDATVGVYSQTGTGETSTLILKNDHSFQQDVTHSGTTEHAHGSWRRIGEGGVVLSSEFLTLPSLKRRSTGEVDGEIKKAFGLFPYIVFNDQPGGPIFNKHFL